MRTHPDIALMIASCNKPAADLLQLVRFLAVYAKPTLSTAPDEIILHIGTNDLKAKTPEAVINAASEPWGVYNPTA